MSYQTSKTTKRVEVSYFDKCNIEWVADCLVCLSYDLEVLWVKIETLNGYNSNNDVISDILAPKEAIEEAAGKRALEQVERCDFDIDTEES